jgi:hypothetical protein
MDLTSLLEMLRATPSAFLLYPHVEKKATLYLLFLDTLSSRLSILLLYLNIYIYIFYSFIQFKYYIFYSHVRERRKEIIKEYR